MNNIDLMNYWIESADEDFNVMLDLKEKNILSIFWTNGYRETIKGTIFKK